MDENLRPAERRHLYILQSPSPVPASAERVGERPAVAHQF